jgi:MYXO-CTERM domain-containing protein
MKLKSILAASAVALAAGYTPVAHADFVATFQGVTFTFGVIDGDSLSFRMQNALSTTNLDWAAATRLGAFSLKDIGLDFSTVTGTAIYLGANGVLGGGDDVSKAGVRDELNANGDPCSAIVNGQKGSMCFDFAPNIPLTDDMKFEINFSSAFTILSAGPHLKILLTDNNDNKVGSLYSQNVPFSSTSSSGIASSSSSSSSTSSGNVPAPNTGSMALLGLGLLAGSFLIRRNSRNS